MRTYTFGQCARLLAIDPKVFRQWVKEDLALQKGDQVSRADRRTRYLTREQLERLADLHERTLPDDDEPGKQPQVPFVAYKLLEERLGRAEETLHVGERTVSSLQEELTQVQEHLTQLEQQVGNLMQWMTLLGGLPAWMEQIETYIEPLAHAREQPDDRLAELEAQHRRQLAEVEAGYQHHIAELEAQLALYRRGQHPESTSPTATKKKARTRLKELPKTLASRHAFAALHHIPDSVVARACNSGKIAAVNGKWLYKSRVIFQALGKRGQSDFYQLFHTRADFTRCKQCPHEIK